MSDTKQCSLCGATKPLTEFHTKPNGQPRARCKVCLCAESRRRDPIWQKANPEKCRARARRWRERNPERASKLACAAVKRYRRRKRDRGQTFLPLDSVPA